MISCIFIPRLMTEALRRRLGETEAPAPDLVDHPALRWMSQRDLADLPLLGSPRTGAEGPAEGEPRSLRPAA